MGTWGTGIFSDDFADDVRGEYRALISFGVEDERAERVVIEKMSCSEKSEAEVFWLALAATQWSIGRLSDKVRDQALEIIDTGRELVNWLDAKERKARSKVLIELRKKLLSPQTAKKKLRKPSNEYCPWKAGQVLAVELPDGNYGAVHVFEIQERKQTCLLPEYYCVEQYGIVGIYDWCGALPTAADFSRMKLCPADAANLITRMGVLYTVAVNGNSREYKNSGAHLCFTVSCEENEERYQKAKTMRTMGGYALEFPDKLSERVVDCLLFQQKHNMIEKDSVWTMLDPNA